MRSSFPGQKLKLAIDGFAPCNYDASSNLPRSQKEFELVGA